MISVGIKEAEMLVITSRTSDIWDGRTSCSSQKLFEIYDCGSICNPIDCKHQVLLELSQRCLGQVPTYNPHSGLLYELLKHTYLSNNGQHSCSAGLSLYYSAGTMKLRYGSRNKRSDNGYGISSSCDESLVTRQRGSTGIWIRPSQEKSMSGDVPSSRYLVAWRTTGGFRETVANGCFQTPRNIH